MFTWTVPLLFLVASIAADCPPGSKLDISFNKCYQFFPSPLPFLAAEQKCNSIGGHLADIQNAFESFNMVAEVGASNFWIGANLLLKSNWTWSSSSPMVYTNWASGQPLNSNPCAYVKNSDHNWESLECYTPLPFMCTINPNASVPDLCATPSPAPPSPPSSPTTSAPVVTRSNGTCINGYTLFSGNGMCYKYYSNVLPFNEANSTCTRDGGMLAKIPSKDVNTFLTTLPGIRCSDSNCPFIGLSCSSSSVFSCYWVDGTPLGSHKNFYYDMGYGFDGFYSLITDDTLVGQYGKWKQVTDAHSFLCQKAASTA